MDRLTLISLEQIMFVKLNLKTFNLAQKAEQKIVNFSINIFEWYFDKNIFEGEGDN